MSTARFLLGLFHVLSNTPLFTKCLATPIPSPSQNYTIDDQNFDQVSYLNPNEWKYSSSMTSGDFHNNSLSSTRNPGSSTSFTFNGTGVWISGPFSPDQARRRIYLDGMDMGLSCANEIFPEPPRPFWGVSGLAHSVHTVLVVHEDSTKTILSVDAWIFQTDGSNQLSHLVNRSSVPAHMAPKRSTNVPEANNSVDKDTKSPKGSRGPKHVTRVTIITAVLLFLGLGGYTTYHLYLSGDRSPGVEANPNISGPSTGQESAGILSASRGAPNHQDSTLSPGNTVLSIATGNPSVTGVTAIQAISPCRTTTVGIPTGIIEESSRTSMTAVDSPPGLLHREGAGETSSRCDAHEYVLPQYQSVAPRPALNWDSSNRAHSFARLSRGVQVPSSDKSAIGGRGNNQAPLSRTADMGGCAGNTGAPENYLRGHLPMSEGHSRVRLPEGPWWDNPTPSDAIISNYFSPAAHEARNVELSPFPYYGTVPTGPGCAPLLDTVDYVNPTTNIAKCKLEGFYPRDWPSMSAPRIEAEQGNRIGPFNDPLLYRWSNYPGFDMDRVGLGPPGSRSMPSTTTVPSCFPDRHFTTEATYLVDPPPGTQEYSQNTGCSTSQQGPSPPGSQLLAMISYAAPGLGEVYSERLNTDMSRTRGFSSRLRNDHCPLGLEMDAYTAPFISESNHGALDNLTAQPHPANNPYSQPLAYLPFGPSLSGSSTPSRIHPSHLSTAPFPHGNTATAFSSNSYFPNDALSQLYGLVKESPFILNNQPEPVLSSEEGQTLVRAVLHVPDCPEVAWQKSDRSIFTLFVDCKAYKCLICGHKKTSLERAVGCVRSHLRHRPFACPGEAFGCTSCKKRANPARFFASSYVKDHVKGQTKKFKCPDSECDAMIRRGGMERHWKSIHKGRPFPIEVLPDYGKRKISTLPPVAI